MDPHQRRGRKKDQIVFQWAMHSLLLSLVQYKAVSNFRPF